MYATRVRIANYGPIRSLDLTPTFRDDGSPRPIILVGTNGSGKSVFLSHIVNGLISAKDSVFTDTPELKEDKVYKIRSGSYINGSVPYYFARVDFERGLRTEELRIRARRNADDEMPGWLSDSIEQQLWRSIPIGTSDIYHPPEYGSDEATLRELVSSNLLLYFPFDRFEDPAWLNSGNLTARAQHLHGAQFYGSTTRHIISYSALTENQDWLFNLVYDIRIGDAASIPLSSTALEIIRTVTRIPDASIRIGGRFNRAIALESSGDLAVPNLFHLSSGETSLLNIFLSILRDFDQCEVDFSSPSDARGTVVVDEIDLHLHAVLQYETLPRLIRFFPNVQFIVTTHSPLFVLGMEREFGENGFTLHRLPDGQQISPEEFSEFGDAYRAFAVTDQFTDDIRSAIENATKPLVLLEGSTDERYLRRAAELLGHADLLGKLDLRDGGGKGNLAKVWTHLRKPLADAMQREVVLLFDCDAERTSRDFGKMHERVIPFQSVNPIRKGIENLFDRDVLGRALAHKKSFIDVDHAHPVTSRGETKQVPEQWTVNEDEKSNLCDWICANGTSEDFRHFEAIFGILAEAAERAT